MKHTKLFLVAVLFSFTMQRAAEAPAEKPDQNYVVTAPPLPPVQSQPPQTIQEMIEADEQETERILVTFLSMVGNFLNILKDPKNPCVVGTQMAQILTGLVAIGMEAFNKSIPLDDEKEFEKCLLDEQFLHALKRQCIVYAEQLKEIQVQQAA